MILARTCWAISAALMLETTAMTFSDDTPIRALVPQGAGHQFVLLGEPHVNKGGSQFPALSEAVLILADSGCEDRLKPGLRT